MSIAVTCEKCGKTLKVDDKYAGKHARCMCGEKLTIPLPAVTSKFEQAVMGAEDAAHKDGKKPSRVEVKDGEVFYQPASFFSFLKKPPKSAKVRHPLLNIGLSGLEFLTSEMLVEGAALALTVKLAGELYPLKMKGTVKWVKKSEKVAKMNQVGVHFTKVPADAAAKIKEVTQKVV
ncbi:MAG: hypothetical protein FJ279_33670 [Planctomycetes bacterium]|nr:hypothetical protein [Planctomycetota bacterium]